MEGDKEDEEESVCVIMSTRPSPEPPYFTTLPVDTRVVSGGCVCVCECVCVGGVSVCECVSVGGVSV